MELAALFSNIAAAIREKDGTAAPITAADFPARIRAISTGDAEITLKSLTVLTPPDKTEYYYNGLFAESFDPAGMAFQARLEAFGVTLDIPVDRSYIRFSPSGPLSAGVDGITASFSFGSQTVTAVQPVTVAYGQPRWGDLEQIERTWAEFEEEFPTWGSVETA